jgi:hypothetical protein
MPATNLCIPFPLSTLEEGGGGGGAVTERGAKIARAAAYRDRSPGGAGAGAYERNTAAEAPVTMTEVLEHT